MRLTRRPHRAGPAAAPRSRGRVRDARPDVCVHLATHFLASQHARRRRAPRRGERPLRRPPRRGAGSASGACRWSTSGASGSTSAARLRPGQPLRGHQAGVGGPAHGVRPAPGPPGRAAHPDRHLRARRRPSPAVSRLLVAARPPVTTWPMSSGPSWSTSCTSTDVVAAFELVIDRLAAPDRPPGAGTGRLHPLRGVVGRTGDHP